MGRAPARGLADDGSRGGVQVNHLQGKQSLAEIRDEQDTFVAPMLPFTDRYHCCHTPTARRRNAAKLGSVLAQAAVSSFLEGGRPQLASYSVRTLRGPELVQFRVTIEALEPVRSRELDEIMALDDEPLNEG